MTLKHLSQGPSPVLLELKNLSKSFDGHQAVRSVNLQFYEGEIFALLGGSGCGKSTLLRMLSGFETLTEGKILLNGEDIAAIPPYRRPFNMMFQSYALFPHMTVEQNIAYGLKQDKLKKEDIAKRVDDMLKLVHMESFRLRKPSQLSGGQRQRVALARSLAKKPKLLLLDEPMGALDKKLRGEMQLELVDIIKQVGVTCVMVTHDQEEAMTMADRIAVMHAGEILQIGSPHDIYEYPNCRYVADFIGEVNLFGGHIAEEEPSYVVINVPNLVAPIYIDHGISGPGGERPVSVAVRPEKVRLSDQQPDEQYNWGKGIIDDLAYLGQHSIYHILLPDGQFIQVTQTNDKRRERPFELEQEIFVSWSPDSCVVLEE
ncbi:ABC transporter ATP-binding protein [Bowmanella dokdonensis]|uniref:Spermidine/putrescine import ATP-binding protein PotA n=1 Tax=Bowmanella dokdonensis TaxID=751969 RepID=A0A939IPP3_9ALTE|nr:polyamine ABC transporter ATP-binding protein [Bowmanella dokdonensis]MBN7827653.1 polyamine ABC transporter ATP-binding protein [Bowmanella dokdonensis]